MTVRLKNRGAGQFGALGHDWGLVGGQLVWDWVVRNSIYQCLGDQSWGLVFVGFTADIYQTKTRPQD